MYSYVCYNEYTKRKGDVLMTTTPTTIRLDDQLRKDLEPRLASAGLSLNGYLTMAAKQLVIQNKVPFDVIVPDEVPNDTTHEALIEAQAKEMGLITDDSPQFEDVDQVMDYLDSEDHE